MKCYKCEMCGKTTTRIQEHHVIPWHFSHDDSDSNIMRVCNSCHKRADANFISLIMYGRMGVSGDTQRRIGHRYRKKYMKYKQLYSVILSKYTYYYDNLFYNIKTDVITISQQWRYIPNKHMSRSLISHIRGRRKMVKAAVVKGQTTLSGGGIK